VQNCRGWLRVEVWRQWYRGVEAAVVSVYGADSADFYLQLRAVLAIGGWQASRLEATANKVTNLTDVWVGWGRSIRVDLETLREVGVCKYKLYNSYHQNDVFIRQ
jgi:hypothetical protein